MDETPLDHTRSLEQALTQCRRELALNLECEQRYRRLFESGLVGVALLEIVRDTQERPCDVRVLEVNEAFGRSTGFFPAQANGRTARELSAHVEQHWFDHLAKVAFSGEPARFEKHLAGLDKWFELFAHQVAPGQVGLVAIDITERKRAEAAAMEQFKLADAVFTHSVSPLVVLARNYNFLRVNEAYARVCHREIGEFVGRNHFEMYPSDAKPIFDTVVREKHPFTTFTRAFRFPDQPERGTTYWDWTLVPVLDEQGEVEFLVFSLVDVTERKRAEEALRASESRYRQQAAELELIYRTAPVGLCILDTQLRYVRINDHLAELNGVPTAAHLGRTVREVVPLVADRVEPLLRRVIETGEPVLDFEASAETQPGVRRTWRSEYWPLKDVEGQVRGINAMAVEVTERRKLEEARQRERQFRTLAENSSDMIVRFDRALRRIYANPALESVLGRPRSEILGKTNRELGLPEPLVAILDRHLEQAFETGQAQTMEVTLPTPKGERVLDSRVVPEFGVDGKVETLLAISRDITERKRMEIAEHQRLEETRQREQEFRSLAENSTDVVARFDRTLRRIYVNRAIEVILGRPRDEILGKTHREMGLPAADAARLQGVLEEVFATGEPRTTEARIPTPKGERYLDSRLVPEFGPDGKVATVLAISRDITERKQTEDALRSSEEKYRTLVENLYEGIWLVDGEGTTTFVNERMAELLGCRTEEILGKTMFDFMSKPATDVARTKLSPGYGGPRAEYEFELRRKDGTAFLSRVATTPLRNARGFYQGLLAAVVDITERKQAEAALQAYADGQDFLVGTALRLLQPLERPALYQLMTERIHALAEGGIVLFNEFDPVNRRVIVRNLATTAEERDKISHLFGYDPIGLTLDFPESIREQILPGELAHLPGGICELAFYQLPQALCDALEHELGIRNVYAMACSVEQDLLGTVAVLTRGKGLVNKRLIETVVSEVSLALKRKRAEEALQNERNFFDTVFDTQGAIVAILDPHYRIIRLNRAYYAITGFPAGGMLGRIFRELMDAGSAKAVERQLDGLVKQRTAGEFESRVRVQDGGIRHVSWRTTVRLDDGGAVDYVIATGIDITERIRMEERTRHLAQHDALTDLPNRRLLLELLDAALQSARRSQNKVAVLFLDLDRFKVVNDTLGHEAGDRLLKEVARRLSGRVRRSDIVARLGGDEFAVLLSELSQGEQAGDVSKELVRTFQQPFHLAEQSLHITASLGISLFPDDSETAEGLLRRADLAMYEAKEQGRNTYRFYNPVVDRRARERAHIENSLRQALERNELRVVFQPEIDLRTGRLIGAEALIRWHHPDLGVLEPARFIPVAEETELIALLDDWVLRAACAQARDWREQGRAPISIAVNLSAKRFESPDLVEAVRRQLAESGMAPEHLELELTEHTVMHRIEQSAERMRELVGLGVSIAIDDFGTGYSSLSYLKQLPIGKLKIDQSFVRDIATDADDRAIIQAVTALAHTLNKRVIAEGVETPTQRSFLEASGCDEAQGYLFAKPLTPQQLAELLMP